MSYKVVRKNSSGILTSCRIWGDLVVIYIPMKWVKPEFGPSLVFDTLAHAEAFIESTCGTCRIKTDIIYRCRTRNRRRIGTILGDFSSDIPETVAAARFWRGYELTKDSLMPSPPGTYAADEVMLTKRIKVIL